MAKDTNSSKAGKEAPASENIQTEYDPDTEWVSPEVRAAREGKTVDMSVNLAEG